MYLPEAEPSSVLATKSQKITSVAVLMYINFYYIDVLSSPDILTFPLCAWKTEVFQ